MAVLREVVLGTGEKLYITDWGDYPIWSRCIVNDPATLVEKYLFSYIQGSTIPGTALSATYADTNMPGAGQLPLGNQMLVYSIQVIPDEFTSTSYPGYMYQEPAGTAAAIYKWTKIFHQTMLTLQIEQSKAFVEGRLDAFPAGGGVDYQFPADSDTASDAYSITNGMRQWSSVRPLASPVSIGAMEQFSVKIHWPRNTLANTQASYEFSTGFGLTVRLTGPRQRQLQ